MNASPMEAARRVDQKTDSTIRLQAARAVMREAARRAAQIAIGCTVAGVEEIEFEDRTDRAFHDYVRSRTDASSGRQYLGVTSGMDQIEQHAAEIGAEPDQKAVA